MSKLNEDTIKALKIAGLKEPVTEGLNKKRLNQYGIQATQSFIEYKRFYAENEEDALKQANEANWFNFPLPDDVDGISDDFYIMDDDIELLYKGDEDE